MSDFAPSRHDPEAAGEDAFRVDYAPYFSGSAAMRALDRVLGHGHYSIPQWYGGTFLVGYRPGPFVLPPVVPPYYDVHDWAMSTWWASPGNR